MAGLTEPDIVHATIDWGDVEGNADGRSVRWLRPRDACRWKDVLYLCVVAFNSLCSLGLEPTNY